MSRIEVLLPLLSQLNESEREQLRAALAVNGSAASTQEYPTIISTPDVCGGSPRLIRTRIAVWMLEEMRRLGFTEAAILESYPSLERSDIEQAFSYAANHREEVEREIKQNEEA